MGYTRKGKPSEKTVYQGKHRFEHWYRDNQVYFITSRVRERKLAFATDETKTVFWDRFDHYTAQYGFTPWITSLIDNHYHTLGYLRVGEKLGSMMQRIHGSVAKLVNDLLPERIKPFWRDSGRQDYFDGCIRDELQCRRAYRYVLRQCIRHRICNDPKDYAHTRINVELERGVNRAKELNAFLEGVRYRRYDVRD